MLEEQRTRNLLGDLAPQFFIDVGQHHACAFGGQQARIGGPQSRGCASDQNDFPCNSSHLKLPRPGGWMSASPCYEW
ncbi:hypothetical protein D3C85_1848910 [compost metagenome]